MGIVKLNTAQANKYSQEFSNLATSCSTVFSEITSIVNELGQDKNTWSGKLSKDFQTQFTELEESFNMALGVFDKTANDLSTAVANLTEADSV